MSSLRKRHELYALLSAVLLSVTTHQIEAADDFTVDDLLVKWEIRQKAIKSARFVFEEQLTTACGTEMGKDKSFPYLFQNQGKAGNSEPSSQLFPANDETRALIRRIIITDDQFRYVVTGMQWEPAVEDFTEREFVYAFNGKRKIEKTLYNNQEGRIFPYGFIDRDRKGFIAQLQIKYTDAIAMWMRPFHPQFGRFTRNDWQIIQRGAKLGDGSVCTVIVQQNAVWVKTCWVEIDSACIRRYTLNRRGEDALVTKLDIEYKDLNGNRVPAGWSRTEFNPQSKRITEALSAKMVSVSLSETITEDEFDLEFPVGTMIKDSAEKQSYILMPDGSHRTVSQSHIAKGIQYKELSDPQFDADHSRGRTPGGMRRIFLCGFMAITAVGILTVLRLRRARTNTRPAAASEDTTH